MQKLLILCAMLLTLSGCSVFSIHRMDIEQGNIVTDDMVKKIHPGMTIAAVKNILGSPVLSNTFADNRLDYVYTYQPGNGKPTEKTITLIFKRDRLERITGNLYSQFIR